MDRSPPSSAEHLPPTSVVGTSYFLRCGHCAQTVEHKKYKCNECGAYVCHTHRRKLKTFMSSTYYCIPDCHPSASTTPSSSVTQRKNGEEDGQSSACSYRGPAKGTNSTASLRPPSASNLTGKVKTLQTSFGVIQEVDHTPPRGDDGDHASIPQYYYCFGGSDGGDAPLPTSAPSVLPQTTGGGSEKTRREVPSKVVAAADGARLQPSEGPQAKEHTDGDDGLVYNHRGELQVLAPSMTQSTSSASSSIHISRSRRSLMADDEQAPTRPPPSLTSLRSSSSSSVSDVTTRPRVRGLGLPFVPPEPVNAESGKRHVMIGPEMMILVTPEEKTRFVEVELSTQGSSGGITVVRGTVLGREATSKDAGSSTPPPPPALIWHERGKRYAQRLLQTDVKSIVVVTPARCKHCGAVLPRDEADEHVASHRLGGGVDLGTAVGDEQLGTACGDTALLLRLVRLKQLGAGAQGDVWLCKDGADVPTPANTTGLPTTPMSPPARRFVQKTIRCADEKEATAKYQQSVRLMGLNHVHIIRYLAVQKAPRDCMITVLMPFYHEGDLGGLIRSQRSAFTEHYVSSLLLQLAAGLNFLHTRTPSIIHGDIKPENVLLFNRREQIVLMDLDASRELSAYHREATGVQIGTTAWMAPETLHHEQSTTRSDIWSLGLVAYVLLVLPDFPMLHCEKTNENELLNSTSWSMDELLRRVGGRIVSRGFSKGIALLITRMLHHDPKRRPHAAEVGEKLTELMTSQLVMGAEAPPSTSA